MELLFSLKLFFYLFTVFKTFQSLFLIRCGQLHIGAIPWESSWIILPFYVLRGEFSSWIIHKWEKQILFSHWTLKINSNKRNNWWWSHGTWSPAGPSRACRSVVVALVLLRLPYYQAWISILLLLFFPAAVESRGLGLEAEGKRLLRGWGHYCQE